MQIGNTHLVYIVMNNSPEKVAGTFQMKNPWHMTHFELVMTSALPLNTQYMPLYQILCSKTPSMLWS